MRVLGVALAASSINQVAGDDDDSDNAGWVSTQARSYSLDAFPVERTVNDPFFIDSALGDLRSSFDQVDALARGLSLTDSTPNHLKDEFLSADTIPRAELAYIDLPSNTRSLVTLFGDFDFAVSFDNGMFEFPLAPVEKSGISAAIFIPVTEVGGVFYGSGASQIGSVGVYVGLPWPEASAGLLTDTSQPEPNLALFANLGPIVVTGGLSAAGMYDLATESVTKSWNSFNERGGEILRQWETGVYEYTNANSFP